MSTIIEENKNIKIKKKSIPGIWDTNFSQLVRIGTETWVRTNEVRQCSRIFVWAEATLAEWHRFVGLWVSIHDATLNKVFYLKCLYSTISNSYVWRIKELTNLLKWLLQYFFKFLSTPLSTVFNIWNSSTLHTHHSNSCFRNNWCSFLLTFISGVLVSGTTDFWRFMVTTDFRYN